MRPRPGDVWIVSPDPVAVGSEIQKPRPAVVVSPAEMNDDLRTVIVVPLSTGAKPKPYRHEIDYQGRLGRALIDQVKAVSLGRLQKRLPNLNAADLAHILEQLRAAFI